jgi:hypothetical protein
MSGAEKQGTVTRGEAVAIGQKAAVYAGLSLTLAFTLSSGAEGRHWHWYHYLQFGNAGVADYPREERSDRRSSSQRSGPLAVLMAQFIHDCRGQAFELKNFPVAAIAQTIDPDDAQDFALKNAGQLIAEAGDQLLRNCPNDVPADPAARLDAMARGVDAVDAALSALQPPLQAFYDSLKDDQKARLVRTYLGGSRSAPPETTGSGGPTFETIRAFDSGTGRRSRASARHVSRTAPIAEAWNCGRWQAELNAWPVWRVEQVIVVAPRQREAFFVLAAAIQRAANMLADSCPREPAVTPIGRIVELKKKLEAVRQSAAEIRPPLGQFYEGLNAAQKTIFSDAI